MKETNQNNLIRSASISHSLGLWVIKLDSLHSSARLLHSLCSWNVYGLSVHCKKAHAASQDDNHSGHRFLYDTSRTHRFLVTSYFLIHSSFHLIKTILLVKLWSIKERNEKLVVLKNDSIEKGSWLGELAFKTRKERKINIYHK